MGGSDDVDPHMVQGFLIDGQTPAGVPVTDAGHINEASSTRSITIMSKPAKIVLLCLTGVLVLACGGGGFAVYLLAKKTDQVTITAAEFTAVRTGENRAQVQAKIGDVGTDGKIAVDKGLEPAVPTGATCDYAVSEDAVDDSPRYVYRFCYVGDNLVEKKQLAAANGSPTK